MVEITEFAHGYRFGDYSGVVFYGPPTAGFWSDRLAVSAAYIGPLFLAILNRFWQETGGEDTPRIASEWNTLTGWADLGAGIVLVQPQDIQVLADALGAVTNADLTPHVAGTTIEDCLRCAETVRRFVLDRLSCGAGVYLEND